MKQARLLVLACMLMGCAKATLDIPQYPTPLPESESAAVEHVPVTPAPAPMILYKERHEPPMAVIAQANREALITPRRSWFTGGFLRYPYRHGARYRIDTGTGAPTALIFDDDETITFAFGLEGKEGERWTVKVPESEEGGQGSRLYIFPSRKGLKAGMTIWTTKAIYLLDLYSHANTGLLAVGWQHPEVKHTSGHGVWDQGVLRMGYVIRTVQGRPLWLPSLAWDTGLNAGKTIVQFPQEIGISNAPVVWAKNSAGVLEMVNFRPDHRRHRYIIDLVTAQLELRYGVDDAAEIVTITRTKDYREVRCPGSAECPIAHEVRP